MRKFQSSCRLSQFVHYSLCSTLDVGVSSSYMLNISAAFHLHKERSVLLHHTWHRYFLSTQICQNKENVLRSCNFYQTGMSKCKQAGRIHSKQRWCDGEKTGSITHNGTTLSPFEDASWEPKKFCLSNSLPTSLRASSTICGTGTSMICCTGRWTNRSSNRACGGSKMLLGVGTNELLWNCIHTTSFNFDSSFCMITGVTSNSSCIWCTGTSTTSQKEFMKRSCQHLVMDNVRPDGNMPGKDGACNTNCCVLQWRM